MCEINHGDGPDATSSIAVFLDRFNLPHLVAGPAGKAISRLIGALTDIPAVKLEQWSQAIKDKTAAKSAVSKAVAQAVAKDVATNAELIERAQHALLAKELRRQSNKESIAQKTIQILNDSEHSEDAVSSEEIDDDWLNIFERYAENASTERLQDLWARVLAGQIRKPHSFSLKTLRFISELDANVAKTFEDLSSRVAFEAFIPMSRDNDNLRGKTLGDLLLLEEFGLIVSFSANLQRPISFNGDKYLIPFGNRGILLNRAESEVDKEVKFNIDGIALTKVGREIFSILPRSDDEHFMREVANKIQKNQLDSIAVCDISRVAEGLLYVNSENIWDSKPRDSQA